MPTGGDSGSSAATLKAVDDDDEDDDDDADDDRLGLGDELIDGCCDLAVEGAEGGMEEDARDPNAVHFQVRD